MPPAARSVCSAVLLLFCLCTGARATQAQQFDLEKNRLQIMSLDGAWRFHTGDDLRWAAPGFDDSGWKQLQLEEPLADQGYKGYAGISWFRTQVTGDNHRGPLALYLQPGAVSYQVYADGHLVGQNGRLLPDFSLASELPAPILIPGSAFRGPALTLAIRMATQSGSADTVPSFKAAFAGDAAEMDRLATDQRLSQLAHWAVQLLEAAVAFSAALAALCFFLLYPTDREYLWFGLYEAFLGWGAMWPWLRTVFEHAETPWEAAYIVNDFLSPILLLLFLWSCLRKRLDPVFWAASGLMVLSCGAYMTALFHLLPEDPCWEASAGFNCLYALIVPVALVSQAWRTDRDTAILAVIAGIDTLISGLASFYSVARHSQLQAFGHLSWLYLPLTTYPLPVTLPDLADTLLQLAFFAFLVRRFVRVRRAEERMSSELEAARTVQQVLVPEAAPTFPGIAIDALYRPAGVVGGDFYQIVPLDERSLIVAIGDVSGKGMPAAMTVSLLVGTLRTLVSYTQSPAALLAGMNERLLGRESGFTTCLVARLNARGEAPTLTLANAGHLQPYLDGDELVLDNGLPLGLTPQTEYGETTLQLRTHQSLVLLTDGIVEARSREGELFGFERTRALLRHSAESIADTACNFGQDDDMTVLKLTCLPQLA